MNTRVCRTLGLVLVFVLVGGSAAAQRIINLEECLEIAIDQSTSVGSFRENLQTARQSILQNYGTFLPNLNMGFYAGRNFVGPTPSVFVDAQGRPVDQAGFDHEQYSFSISSTMLLFDWGASLKNLNSSKRTAEAAEGDLQYQKDIVTALVIREYYNFVRMKNLRTVQEESVDAAQRNLDQVEAFFNIGSNTRADVLQARVRLGNTQLALITATNDQEIAKARLASRLNFPLDEEFDIDSSLEIGRIEPDFQAEVAYMLEHRSDLTAERQRVQAANYRLDAAQNSRWPTISARIGYSWNDRQFPDNANFFTENYGWNLGVSVNYDLFDRFNTKSTIIGAEANRRIAEYNLQQAKLDAVLELRQLYLALLQADEKIRVSTGQVEQAQENLRLAEERYRVGAGTILETIDAAVSLTTAQASLVEGQCDYLIARADLFRATGREVKVQ